METVQNYQPRMGRKRIAQGVSPHCYTQVGDQRKQNEVYPGPRLEEEMDKEVR